MLVLAKLESGDGSYQPVITTAAVSLKLVLFGILMGRGPNFSSGIQG